MYIENKDSSSVGYRRFNQEERDIYPAVSICLQSSKGTIFKKTHNLLHNLGEDGGKIYQDMLLGYANITNDFTNITYNDVTKNLFEDFVDVYFTMTKQGDVIDTWQPNIDYENLPFYKSYQDPYLTCMTKNVN